jgi:hypothetical protein
MTYENLLSLLVAFIGALVFGAISISSFVAWIRDIRFYRNNNWDFSVRRKSSIKHYPSGLYTGKELKRSSVIFIGSPLIIFTSAAISAAIMIFIVQDLMRGFAHGSS